ncbi:unnamed protein product [Rhizoctonia solani]|uniref:DUF2415 domain-containing protein n=1 Tax=Rhizoctonia solani TaxID=456999 RepID=A0A8H3AXM9_9AGAM|nr:unnamed protein product [Rhizoctonia solani]
MTDPEPKHTCIIVSNNNKCIRLFDVDTRESASSKESGMMELTGSVKLRTPTNHVLVSPDGWAMLAVALSTLNASDPIPCRTQLYLGTVLKRPPVCGGIARRPVESSPASSTSSLLSPYLGAPRAYDSRFAGAYTNTEQFLGHGIRSLRFSPAGGNLEMLIFTEDTSHAYVIDAQTFSEHQALNVPTAPRDGPASPLRDPVRLPPTADCGHPSAGMGGYYIPGKGRNTRGEVPSWPPLHIYC